MVVMDLQMSKIECVNYACFPKSGHIFVYSIPRRIFSYIVLGHYPATNSNGMRLKLNYEFIVAKLYL